MSDTSGPTAPPQQEPRFRVLDARPNLSPGPPVAGARPYVLLVNRIPTLEEMVWTEHDGIYVAEHDGYAYGLDYQAGPGPGFNGQRFRLVMADGSQRELVGPLSGGARTVNAGRPDLRAVDVELCEDVPERWGDPYATRYAGAVTAELEQEIRGRFPELAAELDRAAEAEQQRRVEYERQLEAEAEHELER